MAMIKKTVSWDLEGGYAGVAVRRSGQPMIPCIHPYTLNNDQGDGIFNSRLPLAGAASLTTNG